MCADSTTPSASRYLPNMDCLVGKTNCCHALWIKLRLGHLPNSLRKDYASPRTACPAQIRLVRDRPPPGSDSLIAPCPGWDLGGRSLPVVTGEIMINYGPKNSSSSSDRGATVRRSRPKVLFGRSSFRK